MQGPFEPGTPVAIVYDGGYMSEPRTLVKWGEQGIVTATEFHVHFTPFHRINRITVEKEDYPTPHRDRGVAAAAGVG